MLPLLLAYSLRLCVLVFPWWCAEIHLNGPKREQILKGRTKRRPSSGPVVFFLLHSHPCFAGFSMVFNSLPAISAASNSMSPHRQPSNSRSIKEKPNENNPKVEAGPPTSHEIQEKLPEWSKKEEENNQKRLTVLAVKHLHWWLLDHCRWNKIQFGGLAVLRTTSSTIQRNPWFCLSKDFEVVEEKPCERHRSQARLQREEWLVKRVLRQRHGFEKV